MCSADSSEHTKASKQGFLGNWNPGHDGRDLAKSPLVVGILVAAGRAKLLSLVE